jgi:exodeoxyribonuclease VII small subunit
MATSRKTREGKGQKSFESLMEEFEKIVARLESGELSLDESVELFEKGMRLAAEGTRKLDAAEKKVQLLLTADGKERKLPFEQDSSFED